VTVSATFGEEPKDVKRETAVGPLGVQPPSPDRRAIALRKSAVFATLLACTRER
jgi:hypothetical protein